MNAATRAVIERLIKLTNENKPCAHPDDKLDAVGTWTECAACCSIIRTAKIASDRDYVAAIDAAIADARALLEEPASEDAWLSGVIKQIAELPDRNSPEGQPEMMLVTAEELTSILRARPLKESEK